jgi:hypothetical protein
MRFLVCIRHSHTQLKGVWPDILQDISRKAVKGCYSGPDPQPEPYQLLVLGQYEVHVNINTSHFCLPHAPAVVRLPKCVVGVCDAWIYIFLSYIYSYSFLLPLIILLPLSFNPCWDYISFFSFFQVLSFRIFHSFIFSFWTFSTLNPFRFFFILVSFCFLLFLFLFLFL